MPKFSFKDIKGAAFKVGTLSQKQRGAVKEAFRKVKGGGITKGEFKRTMRDLRSSKQISAIDRKAIEKVMFGDKE